MLAGMTELAKGEAKKCSRLVVDGMYRLPETVSFCIPADRGKYPGKRVSPVKRLQVVCLPRTTEFSFFPTTLSLPCVYCVVCVEIGLSGNGLGCARQAEV
ncbi:MAG: hypothetical protein A3G33_06020 [Omnitrophica bacterium RIFCSPLOWO2_12_FULL_44_17]|uniref:Uncharacterized protein n=1 Tax=Candidatus Danuiimicrobium aquiferis TaxID=1801832 RepID=A0A1G1L2G1_9BACT|nr:MAG: hypothetical protein A3B72_06250 [Omnitrophica bacterium RIFCSPHIGHO2_02_FULL_45_28]OGW89560.1 MAG: hypothetical protein A3E74_09255 [Omnitrophica bacterium RIFCSPHIGHO2_12_FULL_44_12]OGW99345.1 MAG: hypothetical protein A3G33_06020 [Omnitrophica bacterium RIFCSPLOWO2_12_FULL_44_17]OGX05107.1 MAG: hypothetical protein A3J12_06730 [Omnitrophica bacterium RIFCSPLOWO2_02_FULL_44_11]